MARPIPKCPGIEIEDGGVYSGCAGGYDCPVCEGEGAVLNCPRCLYPLDEGGFCGQCDWQAESIPP
jgi:hypothetical protein